MSDRVREVRDDPPPFLGTWSNVYAAVLVYLIVLISAFAVFTQAFKR
jgi:hypothetical protein